MTFKNFDRIANMVISGPKVVRSDTKPEIQITGISKVGKEIYCHIGIF